MPLNPYVAWMYQRFGQLDDSSLGLVRSLGESASFIRDECYIGSVALSDQLRQSLADHNIPSDLSDAARGVLVDSVLAGIENALRDTVGDAEKRDLLVQALRYEITGEIPVHERAARWPPLRVPSDVQLAPTSELDRELGALCVKLVGRPLNVGAFEAFNEFIGRIVQAVIGPIMHGQSPPPVPVPFLHLCDPDVAPMQGGAPKPEQHTDTPEIRASSDAPAATPQSGMETAPETSVAVEPEPIEASAAATSKVAVPTANTIATFKRRLAAYVLDYAVVFFIAVSVHFIAAFAGKPIPDDSSSSTLLFLAVLLVYMVIAQAWRHTTVGKYAVGIEVRSDDATSLYPSFLRVLLRETVGRICSFVFWGAGYWTCIGDPRKQAWSDRMASTVVVARPTNRILRQAFSVFLTVVILLDIGVSAYGAYSLNRKKQQQAWLASVQSLGSQIETSRQAIETVIGREVKDWNGYKSDMREMLGLLDTYDRDVASMKTLIVKGLSADLVSSAERPKMQRISDLWGLRQRQSTKRREEAQAVMNFYPGVDSWPSLKARLEMLDSDIEGLDTQASRLARDLGLK